MAAVAVLVAWRGLEQVPAVQVQRLAGARQRALQLQRREVEVFLAAEGELIRHQRIQLFIRRHPKIDAWCAAQRRRGMLRDGHEREVAERWAIVSPAEALRWIGISPIGTEVNAKARILGRRGVRERLHVLSAAEDEAL